MAVGAVLVLVGVLALGGLLGGGDDLDGAVPGPDVPSSAEPAPTTGPEVAPPSLPPVLPSVPELDPRIDPAALARPLAEVAPEIVAFVEAQRGHRFTTPPTVEGLPDAAFEQRLLAAQGGEPAIEPEAVVWLRSLGLLPPGVDPEEAVADLFTSSVQGFYDPETDELVVRGDVITPYVQTVIAHELTHALDDQLFDLTRLDRMADRPDEAAFGLQALIEGSARVVELAYEDQALDSEEQMAVDIEKLAPAADGSADPDRDDLVALALMFTIPYGNGERLVDALLAGGIPALDSAFRAPPTTSEQVLDPDVYAAQEPAVPVEAPEADGPEVGRGAFGAVDVRVLELVADPTAALVDVDPQLLLDALIAVEEVDGFGGGEYVTWEADGTACIRVNLAGDDVAGTQAVTEIVEAWAAVVGAEVTSTGSTTLSFTSCPGETASRA